MININKKTKINFKEVLSNMVQIDLFVEYYSKNGLEEEKCTVHSLQYTAKIENINL